MINDDPRKDKSDEGMTIKLIIFCCVVVGMYKYSSSPSSMLVLD